MKIFRSASGIHHRLDAKMVHAHFGGTPRSRYEVERVRAAFGLIVHSDYLPEPAAIALLDARDMAAEPAPL
ncbi:MAG: hypothetical protein ACRYG4_27555 [Janthinobacterium lividum]